MPSLIAHTSTSFWFFTPIDWENAELNTSSIGLKLHRCSLARFFPRSFSNIRNLIWILKFDWKIRRETLIHYRTHCTLIILKIFCVSLGWFTFDVNWSPKKEKKKRGTFSRSISNDNLSIKWQVQGDKGCKLDK